MKVLGKQTRKVKEFNNISFEVTLIDNFENEEFSEMVARGFLLSRKLSKKLLTDGKVIFMDKVGTVYYYRVRFKLQNATWLVIKNEDEIQLFVTENCESQIKTKDEFVNSFIGVYYKECMNSIIEEKLAIKRQTIIAEQINLPYDLVIAFNGNPKQLERFIESLEILINSEGIKNQYMVNHLISKSQNWRKEALSGFGIYVPLNVKNDIVGDYVYLCIKNKKIIRMYD